MLGDPDGPDRVIADLRADAGGVRAAADHPLHVGLGDCILAQLAGARALRNSQPFGASATPAASIYSARQASSE